MDPYIIFLIALTILAVWSLICNNKAHSQRSKMISSWSGSSNWHELMTEFAAVSYGKHHWYLMTFRDPLKLYGPSTQQIWGKQ